nr:zinc finger, CCHC-type, retrotransposon Gag domain protein [Tanacetum cinerariifolium]
SSELQRFFRYAMFIYSFYLCYSLSLYPFTERYAQPYFLSCLIRQTLLPQIHAEIREEFRTSSGPSDAGGNPPPRFLRLAGFLGAAAGTEEEQAKNFQWGLRRSTLNHLMCMSYTDVAQVANAARNCEILHERDDDDAERLDKRKKSGDRHQPTSQQSSHRNHGHNSDRHGSDR